MPSASACPLLLDPNTHPQQLLRGLEVGLELLENTDNVLWVSSVNLFGIAQSDGSQVAETGFSCTRFVCLHCTALEMVIKRQRGDTLSSILHGSPCQLERALQDGQVAHPVLDRGLPVGVTRHLRGAVHVQRPRDIAVHEQGRAHALPHPLPRSNPREFSVSNSRLPPPNAEHSTTTTHLSLAPRHRLIKLLHRRRECRCVHLSRGKKIEKKSKSPRKVDREGGGAGCLCFANRRDK